MNLVKMIDAYFARKKIERDTEKLKDAVAICESHGFTVCEITTKAGTDYIRAADGSWRRIGGKRDNGAR